MYYSSDRDSKDREGRDSKDRESKERESKDRDEYRTDDEDEQEESRDRKKGPTQRRLEVKFIISLITVMSSYLGQSFFPLGVEISFIHTLLKEEKMPHCKGTKDCCPKRNFILLSKKKFHRNKYMYILIYPEKIF